MLFMFTYLYCCFVVDQKRKNKPGWWYCSNDEVRSEQSQGTVNHLWYTAPKANVSVSEQDFLREPSHITTQTRHTHTLRSMRGRCLIPKSGTSINHLVILVRLVSMTQKIPVTLSYMSSKTTLVCEALGVLMGYLEGQRRILTQKAEKGNLFPLLLCFRWHMYLAMSVQQQTGHKTCGHHSQARSRCYIETNTELMKDNLFKMKKGLTWTWTYRRLSEGWRLCWGLYPTDSPLQVQMQIKKAEATASVFCQTHS